MSGKSCNLLLSKLIINLRGCYWVLVVPNFSKSLIWSEIRGSSKKNEIEDFCFFGTGYWFWVLVWSKLYIDLQ